MEQPDETTKDGTEPDSWLWRVVSFSCRQNIFIWSLLGVPVDISSVHIKDCIKQMQEIYPDTATELLKIQLLAYLGIEYRKQRLAISDLE